MLALCSSQSFLLGKSCLLAVCHVKILVENFRFELLQGCYEAEVHACKFCVSIADPRGVPLFP